MTPSMNADAKEAMDWALRNGSRYPGEYIQQAYLEGVLAERSRPFTVEQREAIMHFFRRMAECDLLGQRISFDEAVDGFAHALGKEHKQ